MMLLFSHLPSFLCRNSASEGCGPPPLGPGLLWPPQSASRGDSCMVFTSGCCRNRAEGIADLVWSYQSVLSRGHTASGINDYLVAMFCSHFREEELDFLLTKAFLLCVAELVGLPLHMVVPATAVGPAGLSPCWDPAEPCTTVGDECSCCPACTTAL